VAYAVTNLGAFGVLAALTTNDRPHDDIREFAGLWNERPAMAALLTVFLLYSSRVPAEVGFIAKWVHLQRRSAAEHDHARSARRAVQRGVSVLLPAHRGDDVHDRRTRGRPSSPRGEDCVAGMLLAMAAVFYLASCPVRC
jgi:NADH-quinone oxidoreductase subunit N